MDTPAKSTNKFFKNKVFIIVAVLVIFVLLAGGYWFLIAGKAKETATTPPTQNSTSSASNNNTSTTSSVTWQRTADGWAAMGTPPACPNPLAIQTPVSLDNVTAILYPGQIRGGNYKPHGGFLFSKTSNNVSVKTPLAASVYRGSRYIEAGEIQYLFDFINPCGIMFRFDHLLTLTSKFQALANKLPAAAENSSGTTPITDSSVEAGEEIATAVGFSKTKNVSVDFGVYDLRSKNKASADAAWAANSMHTPELGQHAICWLDILSSVDMAKVKALPGGDQSQGKTSDYCK